MEGSVEDSSGRVEVRVVDVTGRVVDIDETLLVLVKDDGDGFLGLKAGGCDLLGRRNGVNRCADGGLSW